jgi:uridine monophosphate synthetase
MNRLAIIDGLFAIDAIRFGNFTLKIGMTSPLYLDLRLIISYPRLIDKISRSLWRLAEKTSFDLICGVPYTALALACRLSFDHEIPMILKRKEVKNYGTKKLIEGMYEARQKALIIEDVITSGSSVYETKVELEEVGLQVSDVVVVVDREQGGREMLEQAGLTIHPLLTLTEIVAHLHNEGKIETEIVEEVKTFIKNHKIHETID